MTAADTLALEFDAAADVACDHCRGPVPRADLVADAPRQFCCAGCSTAFAILHENGLEEY